MDRLLVHFHVYYHYQVDYFIEKLKNINGVEWHLYVTFSEKNEDTFRKLLDLKPDAEFLKVENFGYDVWPFIKVMQLTDLDKYKYVVKLHTKRDVRRCSANVIPMKGAEWREALVDGVLYDREYFSKLIRLFEKDDSIGMISNLKTYSKRNWESYRPRILEEMGKLGLECKGDSFCMGTMFIARADVLKSLQNPLLQREVFLDTLDDDKRDFTSAHYYERIFSVLPWSVGLRHVPVSPLKKELFIIKIVRFAEKPVRWIFGIEKKGPYKRKFVRVLGMEFFIEPPKNEK